MIFQSRQLPEHSPTNRALQWQRKQRPALVPSLLRHVDSFLVLEFGDDLGDGYEEVGVEGVPLGVSKDRAIEILVYDM